ncbi:MAG: hypothetical protein U0R19_10390 [Bryobacteraceae bacterium]
MRRKLLPAHHPDLGVSFYNHAVALEKTGDRRASKTAYREAKIIRASHAAESLTGLTVDRKELERRR